MGFYICYGFMLMVRVMLLFCVNSNNTKDVRDKLLRLKSLEQI